MLLLDLTHCAKRTGDLNLAVEFIRSYAERAGIDSQVRYSTGRVAADIDACKPHDTVGISLFYDSALPHFKALRDELKEHKVVAGGPLTRYFSYDKSLSSVSRAASFGELLINPSFSLDQRELTLSQPTIDFFSAQEHVTLSYPLSYGCYWNRCRFCDAYVHNPKFRVVDLELAFDQIDRAITALNRPRSSVRFTGECIARKHVERICEHMLTLEHVDWTTYFRADKVFDNDDTITAMRRSGCRQVHIGVEILSDEGFELLDKGYNVETVVSVIERFHRAGVEVRLSLLSHIPLSTAATYADALANFKRIAGMVDEVRINPVQIYKTSRYYAALAAFGLEVVEDFGYWVSVRPTHIDPAAFEIINHDYVARLHDIFGDVLLNRHGEELET